MLSSKASVTCSSGLILIGLQGQAKVAFCAKHDQETRCVWRERRYSQREDRWTVECISWWNDLLQRRYLNTTSKERHLPPRRSTVSILLLPKTFIILTLILRITILERCFGISVRPIGHLIKLLTGLESSIGHWSCVMHVS
jgi:hypothetical protein